MGARTGSYCLECWREYAKDYNANRRPSAISLKCSGCRVVFDPPQKNHRCGTCNTEHQRRRRKEKPEEYRHLWREVYYRNRQKRLDAQASPEQRAKEQARQRKRYAEDPEYFKTKEHTYRARKFGGEVSKADLKGIVDAAKGCCATCGVYTEGRNRTIDHIIPLAKGGAHATENLQLLCLSCNSRKGSRVIEEKPLSTSE